jgi:hypothetical protein
MRLHATWPIVYHDVRSNFRFDVDDRKFRNMLLYECSRSEERLRLGHTAGDAAPAGSLAAHILGTTRPDARQRVAAARRLADWTRRIADEDWPPPSAEALALISQQLAEWFDDGRVRWAAEYSDLDPHEGPTDMLSTPVGRHLLQAIEWRGFDVMRVSPEAAVLLSAYYGAIRHTLVGCRRCGHLTVLSRRQAKRRQCPSCGARRRSAADSVIRESALAYDRIRKRHRSRPDERHRLTHEIEKIREDNRCGKLSAKAAVHQILATTPPSPRGRPRNDK